MKVLGVVGLPASGKGTFSDVALEMGIPVVVMGDVIRKAAEERGLPMTDQSLGEIARTIRAEQGMDAIARLCIPAIEATGAPVVLVDGIRSDREVAVFRAYFPDFSLIGLSSSFEARLHRLTGRGRPDDTQDPAALRSRDERELSFGLGQALSQADHTIENEGTVDELREATRELLASVLEAGP